jgi:hypothetical protein
MYCVALGAVSNRSEELACRDSVEVTAGVASRRRLLQILHFALIRNCAKRSREKYSASLRLLHALIHALAAALIKGMQRVMVEQPLRKRGVTTDGVLGRKWQPRLEITIAGPAERIAAQHSHHSARLL